jgi:hypothetical protein
MDPAIKKIKTDIKADALISLNICSVVWFLDMIEKIKHGNPIFATRRVIKEVSYPKFSFAHRKPIPLHKNIGAIIFRISTTIPIVFLTLGYYFTG